MNDRIPPDPKLTRAYLIGYAIGSHIIPIVVGAALGLIALALWRTL